MPSSIVRKAVVPVAGFGTSFLPETKTMPKAMLPIVDIPAIQFVIEEITKSGIEEILLISGHAKRAVEDHFVPLRNWRTSSSSPVRPPFWKKSAISPK